MLAEMFAVVKTEKEYLCEQSRTKEKKFGRNVVPRYYVAGI